ncbi:unnamed protein product, partial [Owenia fusiformis]
FGHMDDQFLTFDSDLIVGMLTLGVLLLVCSLRASEGFLFEEGARLVTYKLYTRRTPTGELIDKSSFLKSSYNPNVPTKLVTHGWFGDLPTFDDMIEALIEKEDVNVIRLDWVDWSSNLDYLQVVEEVPDVAMAIKGFLDYMIQDGGLKLKDLHFIGFSLGAQVAAFVGKQYTTQQIARITCLDPSGLGFDNSDAKKSIHKTDAEFVDVLHTSGLSAEPRGHVDFWPNNGDETHALCPLLFAETIRQSCDFTARQCNNWEEFVNKKCESNATNTMGYMASKTGAQGNLYLEINGYEKPFCKKSKQL